MRILSTLSILVISCSTLISQSGELCRGAYYSEEQGAAKLMSVQRSLHNLSDWNNHADSIRKQLKKGMGLEAFPERTVLNVKSRKKHALNGYTVEAIVFESFLGFL